MSTSNTANISEMYTSYGNGGSVMLESDNVSYPSLGLLKSFWHVESLERAMRICPVSGSSLYIYIVIENTYEINERSYIH